MMDFLCFSSSDKFQSYKYRRAERFPLLEHVINDELVRLELIDRFQTPGKKFLPDSSTAITIYINSLFGTFSLRREDVLTSVLLHEGLSMDWQACQASPIDFSLIYEKDREKIKRGMIIIVEAREADDPHIPMLNEKMIVLLIPRKS